MEEIKNKIQEIIDTDNVVLFMKGTQTSRNVVFLPIQLQFYIILM